MTEIINFTSRIQADSHQSITDDEARLFSIHDVAVDLIIDIEEGETFSMAQIKEQLIEIL